MDNENVKLCPFLKNIINYDNYGNKISKDYPNIAYTEMSFGECYGSQCAAFDGIPVLGTYSCKLLKKGI